MGSILKFLRWLFSGEKEKSVSIFVGAFFMVNFCLGTGFLGIPFSFFYAGYLAAIPTLLLIAFVSWNNAEWEIETMARAQVRITLQAYKRISRRHWSASLRVHYMST